MALKIENNCFIWNKNDANDILSEHFGTKEMTCQCKHPECIQQKVDINLILKLEQLRKEYNLPIRVTSGYRCQAHQDDLSASGKETAKNSQHVLGKASDIQAQDMDKLWTLCEKYFMARGKANSFIHVDIRATNTPIVWYYKKS